MVHMEMELDNNVAKFLQGKTILVTGATGFLGKVFMEKILRIQPNVNKLYLLLRAQDDKSATQRMHDQIISRELFRVLRHNWGSKFDAFISSKVTAVAGDISSENLGVRDSKLREEMWKEIDIIVNVAATTEFYERYDIALGINTFGAFNVLNFAKKCDNIKLLLHTSTAYVCGEQSGMILETLTETNNINIFEEKRIVEEQLEQQKQQEVSNKAITSSMKKFGDERAKLNGWPNTYVFTKAMGEMVLGKLKGDLALVIIRPTMIASSYKQPFPGWIEGVKTMDSIIVNYGKGKLSCFLGDLNTPLDVIPVDMVVNVMVVAMETHYANHQKSCETTIYHVSSSFRNPITISDLRNFMHCYFTRTPWIDGNGKKEKVRKFTVFSTSGFSLYMNTKYVLLLKVFYLVNLLSCQHFKKVHTDLGRKIKFAIRLAEFYKPYVFFKGIFDDRNVEKLQRVAGERGVDVAHHFNFDSKSIDWKDYIMNIHIPGLLKHVISS